MSLTSKQDGFARYVAEGETFSAAYRKAYNAENMSDDAVKVEASRLMNNPNITLTVADIQNEARERTLVTIEGQTARLKALSMEAEGYGTPAGISAAINAEKEINKLNGLIVDKSDHTSSDGSVTPRAWETMYAKPESDDSDTNRTILAA